MHSEAIHSEAIHSEAMHDPMSDLPQLPEGLSDLTSLLRNWGESGDREAFDRLLPMVSGELRSIAGRLFSQERSDHTLQPTALVSEAYLRLAGRQQARWQDRAHFYNFAAKIMRRILVDHARRHSAEKRGASLELVPVEDNDAAVPPRPVDILDLDQALDALAALDTRQARILELRYFTGMTIDEICLTEELSRATVFRELSMARAWVKRALAG